MLARLGFTLPLLTAGLYLYLTEQIRVPMFGDPLGPRAFPRVIVGVLVLAALIWLLEGIVRGRRFAARADVNAGEDDAGPPEPMSLLALVVIGWTALYAVSMEILGFLSATVIFSSALIVYFNWPRWKAGLAAAVLFSLFAYLAFTKLLLIPLPRGVVLPF